MAKTVAQKREDIVSKVSGEIEAISYGPLDELANDLLDKLANMEENFADTERYSLMEDAEGQLREAAEALQGVVDTLANIEFNW
jgi:hypothetical protein